MLKKARSIFGIIMLSLCLSCMISTVMASPVYAKTVTTQVSLGKAKKVKKGTTTIKVPHKGTKPGSVKFVVPKNGTYKFTVSNVTTDHISANNKRLINGYFQIGYKDRYGLGIYNVKTQGGRTYSPSICSQDSWVVEGCPKSLYSNQPKRTATVKLKKGQTVYIQFWFAEYNGTCKLNIKKK